MTGNDDVDLALVVSEGCRRNWIESLVPYGRNPFIVLGGGGLGFVDGAF